MLKINMKSTGKISDICSNLIVHVVDATLMSLFLIVRQECSETKWQAVYSIGAQTRFGEKYLNNIFLLFALILWTEVVIRWASK